MLRSVTLSLLKEGPLAQPLKLMGPEKAALLLQRPVRSMTMDRGAQGRRPEGDEGTRPDAFVGSATGKVGRIEAIGRGAGPGVMEVKTENRDEGGPEGASRAATFGSGLQTGNQHRR